MHERIRVIEDLEEIPGKAQVEQEAQELRGVMTSSQDSDSRNLGSTTSKNSINQMWIGYPDEGQARWVVDSHSMSHIITRRDLFLEDTLKPVP